jgi:hypothetical protein
VSYQESQERITTAEAAWRAGDLDKARVLYREAAELQRAFVNAQPTERIRTRSVYSLSAATLFFKAGDLDEAEQLARDLLVESWIEPGSASKLRFLLKLIADERVAGAPGVVRQRLQMLGVFGRRPPRRPVFHDARP